MIHIMIHVLGLFVAEKYPNLQINCISQLPTTLSNFSKLFPPLIFHRYALRVAIFAGVVRFSNTSPLYSFSLHVLH